MLSRKAIRTPPPRWLTNRFSYYIFWVLVLLYFMFMCVLKCDRSQFTERRAKQDFTNATKCNEVDYSLDPVCIGKQPMSRVKPSSFWDSGGKCDFRCSDLVT